MHAQVRNQVSHVPLELRGDFALLTGMLKPSGAERLAAFCSGADAAALRESRQNSEFATGNSAARVALNVAMTTLLCQGDTCPSAKSRRPTRSRKSASRTCAMRWTLCSTGPGRATRCNHSGPKFIAFVDGLTGTAPTAPCHATPRVAACATCALQIDHLSGARAGSQGLHPDLEDIGRVTLSAEQFSALLAQASNNRAPSGAPRRNIAALRPQTFRSTKAKPETLSVRAHPFRSSPIPLSRAQCLPTRTEFLCCSPAFRTAARATCYGST